MCAPPPRLRLRAIGSDSLDCLVLAGASPTTPSDNFSAAGCGLDAQWAAGAEVHSGGEGRRLHAGSRWGVLSRLARSDVSVAAAQTPAGIIAGCSARIALLERHRLMMRVHCARVLARIRQHQSCGPSCGLRRGGTPPGHLCRGLASPPRASPSVSWTTRILGEIGARAFVRTNLCAHFIL